MFTWEPADLCYKPACQCPTEVPLLSASGRSRCFWVHACSGWGGWGGTNLLSGRNKNQIQQKSAKNGTLTKSKFIYVSKFAEYFLLQNLGIFNFRIRTFGWVECAQRHCASQLSVCVMVHADTPNVHSCSVSHSGSELSGHFK